MTPVALLVAGTAAEDDAPSRGGAATPRPDWADLASTLPATAEPAVAADGVTAAVEGACAGAGSLASTADEDAAPLLAGP